MCTYFRLLILPNQPSHSLCPLPNESNPSLSPTFATKSFQALSLISALTWGAHQSLLPSILALSIPICLDNQMFLYHTLSLWTILLNWWFTAKVFQDTLYLVFYLWKKYSLFSHLFVCLFSFCLFFSAIADALPLCPNSSFPFQENQNSLTWTWQATWIKLNKSAIIRLMVYILISFVDHNTDFPYLSFMKAFMFIIRHNKTQKKQWISCFSIWINEEQSNYHDWW